MIVLCCSYITVFIREADDEHLMISWYISLHHTLLEPLERTHSDSMLLVKSLLSILCQGNHISLKFNIILFGLLLLSFTCGLCSVHILIILSCFPRGQTSVICLCILPLYLRHVGLRIYLILSPCRFHLCPNQRQLTPRLDEARHSVYSDVKIVRKLSSIIQMPHLHDKRG